MDDPAISWPAWKFGLKRDDLYTTLHDQYNTFSYSLQDPEAFHHDVYEISNDAESAADFHRLMADRKQQRLQELNESLETLSVEIIANPKLMATEQWQHALQLFRTKSYDSIVRFFASYIPEHYLDRHGGDFSTPSLSISNSTPVSTKTSSVDDTSCAVYDDDDYPSEVINMSNEPCCLDSHILPNSRCAVGPLSPPETDDARSETSVSTTDVDSVASTYSSTNPPSRSMSFSGSEASFDPSSIRRTFTFETSQSDDCETLATSVSDCAEVRSSIECPEGKHFFTDVIDDDDEDEFPPAQYPEDEFDSFDTLNDTQKSDTPTPRQEVPPSSSSSTCYVDYKSVLSRRMPSPYRRSPSPKSHIFAARGEAQTVQGIRRSPEEVHSKIQKPASDSIRKRPKGRI